MKKQSDSRILNVLKNIFNVRSWVDYDRMRAFTLYLGGGFKKMFIPQPVKKSNTESFKKAVAMQKLTESDILARQKGLYRLSILMCVFAASIFGYSIYQMLYGSLRAMIVSHVLTLIALVLAFRYHFWYYQIKERKLGCTFREWYKHGLLGRKNE